LEESVAECKRVLSSRNFHVRTDGTIAHSLATDTVKYLLKGMLRNVVTPATESYRDDTLKTISFRGQTYKVSKVFAYIDRNNIEQKSFKGSDLFIPDSLMNNFDGDRSVVKESPIIVVEDYSETAGSTLHVVYGLEHAVQVMNNNCKSIKFIPGFELTEKQLRQSQLDDESSLYMDVSQGLPTHLLQSVNSKPQGSNLVSTQTSMLSAGIGNVHLTTQVNGVMVAVEGENNGKPDVNMPHQTYYSPEEQGVWIRSVKRNLIGYPRSYASGIDQAKIDNFELKEDSCLDAHYNSETGKYHILGPYVLLAKLMESNAEHFPVKVASSTKTQESASNTLYQDVATKLANFSKT
jgi:hypothetical protein